MYDVIVMYDGCPSTTLLTNVSREQAMAYMRKHWLRFTRHAKTELAMVDRETGRLNSFVL